MAICVALLRGINVGGKNLIKIATQSRINRIASLPIYENMTLRSWSTTTRLLRMMDEA